jgi:hypothetical protein
MDVLPRKKGFLHLLKNGREIMPIYMISLPLSKVGIELRTLPSYAS